MKVSVCWLRGRRRSAEAESSRGSLGLRLFFSHDSDNALDDILHAAGVVGEKPDESADDPAQAVEPIEWVRDRARNGKDVVAVNELGGGGSRAARLK